MKNYSIDQLSVRWLSGWLDAEHMKIAAKKGENDPLTVEDIKSMEYTWRVVQETMRLTPVVNMGMRVATKDFQYNGFTIPKGWKVSLSLSLCIIMPVNRMSSLLTLDLNPYERSPSGKKY